MCFLLFLLPHTPNLNPAKPPRAWQSMRRISKGADAQGRTRGFRFPDGRPASPELPSPSPSRRWRATPPKGERRCAGSQRKQMYTAARGENRFPDELPPPSRAGVPAQKKYGIPLLKYAVFFQIDLASIVQHANELHSLHELNVRLHFLLVAVDTLHGVPHVFVVNPLHFGTVVQNAFLLQEVLLLLVQIN